MEIFEEVIGLDELNLYNQENGKIFEVDTKEMEAFHGINYIMAINIKILES